MTGRIAIADYGAGNMLSVLRALRHLEAEVDLVSEPDAIRAADRLLVPGVGSFAACVDGLARRNLADAVRAFAATGRPLLGICVGMQMLFDSSEEFGFHAGLGILPGAVKRIPSAGGVTPLGVHSHDGRPHKIPHVGWNGLRPVDGRGWEGTLLDAVPPGAHVYFVHSYTAHPAAGGVRLADSDYDGCVISAAVSRDNVHGCQFHPEKSGEVGLAILRNFLAL